MKKKQKRLSLAFVAKVVVTTATTEVVIPLSALLLLSGVGITVMSILHDDYSRVEISREKISLRGREKEKNLNYNENCHI